MEFSIISILQVATIAAMYMLMTACQQAAAALLPTAHPGQD